ncbi:ELM1/GtrOC1 family putative glycosyltransferase [Sulfurospirillum arcachonense]|uniref:ELM1/GtrOC1 family putative glycosyltransferase n=1 Tax=Sulfurospirillum arcachonense TaxID=57666 RepID=UPI000469932C|nr:ELM1/GtrOC1 family putative glycosyltransferase [Sulfurospirillum arcachonense]
MKILILSDKKAGHVNQSIAFAKLKNLEYNILEVDNNLKILTYLLDFFGIYINLFDLKAKNNNYQAIVSAGSATYYANKYLAKKLNIKSIAIMLPSSFRYSDFDCILACSHDNPPKEKNIIELPINLSISEPKGYIKHKDQKALGIIVGGSNNIFEMKKEEIKKELDSIFKKYPNHLKYITTSRRTPSQIDTLLENYDFDYSVIYSKNPSINPIPDFLHVCEELFITIDSTSMLSEAKANSNASLHVINLQANKQDTKYHKLANIVQNIDGKFDYTPYLQKVAL